MTIQFFGNMKVFGQLKALATQLLLDYKLITISVTTIKDYGLITDAVIDEEDFGNV